MAKSIENKEDITFEEFRAWLTGLIRGKRGGLPDLEDWKQIKVMMDKVEEGRKHQNFPLAPPYSPPIFIDPPYEDTRYRPWYNPNQTWCTTSAEDLNFGDLNIDIPELKDPNIGTIANISANGTQQSVEDFDKNIEEFETAMNEMLGKKNNGR